MPKGSTTAATRLAARTPLAATAIMAALALAACANPDPPGSGPASTTAASGPGHTSVGADGMLPNGILDGTGGEQP